MNKIQNLTLFAILISSLSCSLGKRSAGAVKTEYVPGAARSSQIGMRKRIMVLPFIDVKKNRSLRTAKAARASFVSRLINTNRFVVVSSADLGKDIGQFLGPEGYDLGKIAKLASLIDVSAVIEGSVLDLRAKKMGDEVGVFRNITARVSASVKIRVVASRNQKEVFSDVRTSTVESTTRVTGRSSMSSRGLDEDPRLVQSAVSKALAGSMAGIVRSMDKMEWEGRIAMIRGDRIFVNAGRLTGIQVGDILRISSEGEEVYDPESGVFIGKAPGRGKGTVEVVSYFGKDGAVAIIHSGGGFSQNDKVELY